MASAQVWRGLCLLGDRTGFDVVFVTAQPERWAAELAEILHPGVDTVLASTSSARPALESPRCVALVR